MQNDTPQPSLPEVFDRYRELNRTIFSDDAQERLDQVVSWVDQADRTKILPADLLLILMKTDGLTFAFDKVEDPSQVDFSHYIDALSKLTTNELRFPRVGKSARLHYNSMTPGMRAILQDARRSAMDRGSSKIEVKDLTRVVEWRIYSQDSFSIRWAMSQLGAAGPNLRWIGRSGALLRDAFTEDLWLALESAAETSGEMGLNHICSPVLIAALCDIPDGVLSGAITAAGASPEDIKRELHASLSERIKKVPPPRLTISKTTSGVSRLLLQAAFTAYQDASLIQESHILQALLKQEGQTREFLIDKGIIKTLAPLVSTDVDLTQPYTGRIQHLSTRLDARRLPLQQRRRSSSVLDQIGKNLTAQAKAGELPPVLGRETELQRIVNVLLRTEQKNPLLTGKAGVGKTALAAALAQRIHDGLVPKQLKKMTIVEINGASLLSGTTYRGDLEERIKNLLKEAEDNVVLFIDEAHSVFAPITSSGQPAEVPNHFKAALASGRIAVIAATTESEYRRWIEKDPALNRRFERIAIPELDSDSTTQILNSLVPKYEELYEVKISEEAVLAATELSDRFIPEQTQPDKAKKLLMDSAIAASTERALNPDLFAAASSDDRGKGSGEDAGITVGREDVAKQVAAKTGIPLDRIQRSSALGWWASLGKRLRDKIHGQDAALEEISSNILVSQLRSADSPAPMAVFGFVGPAGTEQAEIAKTLAAEIFGNKDSMLRLDMSDYQEAFSLSRLIGAPPGYVGYQDEDALVTPLRRDPAQVVLMSNFDRAHISVQKKLLNMIQEGRATDSRGMSADLRHALFILSFERDAAASSTIGFGDGASSRGRLLAPELVKALQKIDAKIITLSGVSDPSGDYKAALIRERLAKFKHTLETEYGQRLDNEERLFDELSEQSAQIRSADALEPIFRRLVIEPTLATLLNKLSTPAGEDPGQDKGAEQDSADEDDTTEDTPDTGDLRPTPERVKR